MKTYLITFIFLLSACGSHQDINYSELHTNTGKTVICKMPKPCKRGTLLFNCSDGNNYKCW